MEEFCKANEDFEKIIKHNPLEIINKQKMKQINIFDEIDYINDDGEINRCEICGRSIENGDICSLECGNVWIDQ